MGPLEQASLKELVDEIQKRVHNSLIYFEYQDHDNWCFFRGYTGDLLRLHGAMDLRIIPYLTEMYEAHHSQDEHKDPEDD